MNILETEKGKKLKLALPCQEGGMGSEERKRRTGKKGDQSGLVVLWCSTGPETSLRKLENS